jgi:hypothetical protein
MTRLFLAALLLTAVLPHAVAAQRLPTELLPLPGARIRILTPSGDRLAGTLGPAWARAVGAPMADDPPRSRR